MTALLQSVYLQSYLEPLAPILGRTDVTDVFINRPGEVWIEAIGGAIERRDVPDLDETMLWRLARQVASQSSQGVSREHPLLSATLPGGERIQIAAPPATRGHVAMAIRKQVVAKLTLADYDADHAFDAVRTDARSESEELDDSLRGLLSAGRISEFLRTAVRGRKNIVISGGTSTGKTTFLNALLREAPETERLILVEDTPEVEIDHPNAVGLLAVRGETGEARVTANDLIQAALRMRPDRIILGELRGGEAASFLRAVNSGHPGSITTVHADSPDGAIDQIALLVLQSGLNLGRTEIHAYIRGIVDVFVQLSRHDGRRRVSQVVFAPKRG
jgi:type IV secretion system protein VirB11